MARTLDGPARPAERRRLIALLSRPPEEAARALLGQLLVRRSEGRGRPARVARIVEAEAYLAERDPAAHAFRGRTARTEPLWGRPGTVYVYFIYGVHHCLNLAVQRAGVPGCVLVRAAEPLPGQGLRSDACRGPGKLCRTLRLDRRDSGRSAFGRDGRLWLREGPPPARVGVSPRVGVRRAADWPLRFYDLDSPAVSGSTRVAASGRSPSPETPTGRPRGDERRAERQAVNPSVAVRGAHAAGVLRETKVKESTGERSSIHG